MTRLTSCIRRILGTFAGREIGSLSVESVLIFPILVWTVTLTYTFFDGFRENTANLKAAYTISDLISREGENEITDTYATSMYLLFNRMVANNSPLKMRLTVVTYKKDDNEHVVNWTTRCGYESAWTNDNVNELANRLPPMADLDTLIIVETSKDYVPVLNTSWLTRDHTFDNLIFTRPRFVPIVKGNPSAEFCQQDVPAVGVAPEA